jgi:hypothetical protein
MTTKGAPARVDLQAWEAMLKQVSKEAWRSEHRLLAYLISFAIQEIRSIRRSGKF